MHTFHVAFTYRTPMVNVINTCTTESAVVRLLDVNLTPPVTFDGIYVNGKRHGIGKLTLPNGDRYHGEFE